MNYKDLPSCLIGLETIDGEISIVKGFIKNYSRKSITNILNTHYLTKESVKKLMHLGDFRELGETPIVNPFFMKYGDDFFDKSQEMSDEEYSAMIFSQDEYIIPFCRKDNPKKQVFNYANNRLVLESHEPYYIYFDIFLFSEKNKCWILRRAGAKSNYLEVK